MSGHDHEKCLVYFERISELLDGELDAATAEKVRAHLEGCPECRVCWATFQKSVEIFRHLGDEPLPEGTLKEIKDFIREQLPGDR